MRTSRVSRETAKISNPFSPNTSSTRHQTRSFAASLSAYAANGSPDTDVPTVSKREDLSDDTSDLSTTVSEGNGDIEDIIRHSSSQKRKRGADTRTTVTSISSSLTERLTPEKREISYEGIGDGKPKKIRRQPAKKLVNDNGKVEIHPPDNWEEIYSAVTDMRKRALAPVDTMGCETLAQEQASPRVCSVNLLAIPKH